MINSIKELLKKYHEDKQYSVIIDLVNVLNPVEASHLIAKATAMQLSDDTEHSLKDIEKVYLKAIKIDPDHIDTYYELGFFYQNVLDDTKLAEKMFWIGKQKLKELNNYYKSLERKIDLS